MGCSPEPAPVAPAETSPVLAEVGSRRITRADFDAEIARQRSAGHVPASAKEVLDALVERQAMLTQAEAMGLDKDSAFVRDSETRLLSLYIEGSIAKAKQAVTVTDDDLRAAYEARKDSTFKGAELTRLALLYRRVAKGASPELAGELAAELAKGVAAFEADRAGATQNGRIPGFGKIAADFSEDTVSRYRGGDQGWFDFSKDETASTRLPKEVVEAGRALEAGKISAPFAAGDGVYVVMKDAVRSTADKTFEEAAPLMRRRLLREKQNEIERHMKAELVASVPVKIHEARVGELTVPQEKAPSPKPPRGPFSLPE
jgi:hypothetical protein